MLGVLFTEAQPWSANEAWVIPGAGLTQSSIPHLLTGAVPRRRSCTIPTPAERRLPDPLYGGPPGCALPRSLTDLSSCVDGPVQDSTGRTVCFSMVVVCCLELFFWGGLLLHCHPPPRPDCIVSSPQRLHVEVLVATSVL